MKQVTALLFSIVLLAGTNPLIAKVGTTAASPGGETGNVHDLKERTSNDAYSMSGGTSSQEEVRSVDTVPTRKMPAVEGTPLKYTAKLEPKSGSKANGTVVLEPKDDRIALKINLYDLSEGKHGVHIHEGNCQSADASSAGGHYNPNNKKHGALLDDESHVGDLGNVIVNKDGKGTKTAYLSRSGDFTNWSQLVGKAIVVHEKADDLKSQPAGDSGDRIACGEIKSTTRNAE